MFSNEEFQIMVSKRWGWRIAGGVLVLAMTGLAGGQERADARGALVQGVRNPNQAFQVRVSVDHENRVYEAVSYTHLTLPTNREV